MMVLLLGIVVLAGWAVLCALLTPVIGLTAGALLSFIGGGVIGWKVMDRIFRA